MKKKKPFLIYLLMILMIFQAISAIPSGLLIVMKPSGQNLGLPLSHLENSPFNNYLIPGLFLLIIMGIIPLLTFVGLIRPKVFRFFELLNIYKKQHWPWTYSYYTGIILIIWINVQQLIIMQWDFLQLVYSLLGLSIIILVQYPTVIKYYEK